MHRTFLKLLASSALAVAVAGCGGGGGGGLNSTPTPGPVPTPTPSPAPAVANVIVFPAVTASTNFAVLGLEASAPGPGQTIKSGGFSVRYDASQKTYYMDLPSTDVLNLEEFTANTPNATWWNGQLADQAWGIPGAVIHVLKPTNPQLQLSYTTLAYYDTSGMNPDDFGVFAFGQATPAGNVPVTGSATYAALVKGLSSDNIWAVDGNAMLSFNFGAGTLTGHMDAIVTNGWDAFSPVRYDFTNTIFGVGSTSFSGRLSSAGVSPGSFEGMFTGPNAQELMAVWQAPHAQSGTTIFGAWVGKKQ